MDAIPDHDYSGFQEEKKYSGEDLRKKALELVKAEKDMEEAKAAFTKAETRFREISEKELPAMFEDLGTDRYKLTDDITIVVGEVIIASPLKDNYDKVMNWLEDNNNEGMIKREFKISFSKAEQKWADKFARDLAQRKKPLPCKIERKVHPQTLSAFARERLEEGKELPDIFGVLKFQKAKIKVKT